MNTTTNNAKRDSIRRIVPHSIESELAFLGALLLGDRSANAFAISLLTPDSFYRLAHADIFNAMSKINSTGAMIDIIVLQDQMEKDGTLDTIGLPYLYSLTDIEFTTANVEFYAHIIADKYQKRIMIEQASEIAKRAYEDEDSAEEIAKMFVSHALASGRGNTAKLPSADSTTVVLETATWLEKIESDGLLFGIPTLDKLTTGLHPSELTIITGLSGEGKTALACQALITSGRAGKRCLVVTAEMPQTQLCARMAYSIAGVDSTIVREDNWYALTNDERQRMSDALAEIAAMPFIWIDNRGTSVSFDRIETVAQEMAVSGGIDLFFADYAQIIKPPRGKYNDDRERIEALTRSFALLTTRLDCAGILLSQLARSGELKGSQSLDADPHTIIRLTMEQEPQSPEDATILKANVTKQRNGATGHTRIAFYKKYGRFTDVDYRHGA